MSTFASTKVLLLKNGHWTTVCADAPLVVLVERSTAYVAGQQGFLGMLVPPNVAEWPSVECVSPADA